MRSNLVEEHPAHRKRRVPKPGEWPPRKAMALAELQPDTPTAQLSMSFLNEAKKLDQELRETWKTIQKDVVRVGEILLEMKTKRMHIALGYPNFENYVQDACGQSKTQAFEAMRIVRELTTGPAALPAAAVSRMSRENAKRVIRLKEYGVRITHQIVEAAQTLPEKQFLEDIEYPALKKQGVAPTEGAVLCRQTLVLPGEILDQLLHAHEIMKWMSRDDQRDLPLDQKAWQMMAVEIISTYGAEYEQEKMRSAEADLVAPEASAAAAESEPHTPGAKSAMISAAEEAQKPTMLSKRKMKKASASEAQSEAGAAG